MLRRTFGLWVLSPSVVRATNMITAAHAADTPTAAHVTMVVRTGAESIGDQRRMGFFRVTDPNPGEAVPFHHRIGLGAGGSDVAVSLHTSR